VRLFKGCTQLESVEKFDLGWNGIKNVGYLFRFNFPLFIVMDVERKINFLARDHVSASSFSNRVLEHRSRILRGMA
jgi:hypothetical protein